MEVLSGKWYNLGDRDAANTPIIDTINLITAGRRQTLLYPNLLSPASKFGGYMSDSEIPESYQFPVKPDGFTLVDSDMVEILSQWTWHRDKNGYIARSTSIKGKKRTILMHRFVIDAPQHLDVDHINGNKLDNRRSNLRAVTTRQNCQNRKDNTSGYPGVSRDNRYTRRWVANVNVGKKHVYVGKFDTPEEASQAYYKYLDEHNLS